MQAKKQAKMTSAIFLCPPVNATLMQPFCSIVCFSALVVLLRAMMRGKIATASVRNLTRGKIRGS